MRVSHFGNTANNAFHNALLLEEHAGVESNLPIRMFGLGHGISAPAWEVVDFEVPAPEWVAAPDWSIFPEAVAVNAKYTDLPVPVPVSADAPSVPSPPAGPVALARRWVNSAVNGKSWAQPLVDLRARQAIAARTTIEEPEGTVTIVYGADSLSSVMVADGAERTVCLEHGTIRWIADGSRETSVLRKAYREQVQRALHVWVTNLDPRTLEVVEDVVPGRWSAFPHPFVPDARVPFAETPRRARLLAQTSSQFLVLLPSSQNWSKHHDKGSMKALRAFVELRRKGVDVGLVAVEWGLQLAESKQYLDAEGVGSNVAWVAPMARLGLQRTMADVDVVWDQFGLEAFGALALRAVEQGTPLVSRGLAPAGEQLIGGPVPWIHAASTEDIVRETSSVFEDMGRRGRTAVIDSTRARYRAWFLERHSSAITARLQTDLYSTMLDGTFAPASAKPDQWARLLDEPQRPQEKVS